MIISARVDEVAKIKGKHWARGAEINQLGSLGLNVKCCETAKPPRKQNQVHLGIERDHLLQSSLKKKWPKRRDEGFDIKLYITMLKYNYCVCVSVR